ncbi:DUF4124 domain-containing protein [Variovorax sp. OV329]|uniref:DUF4124 domain-containing protein n=1 Tax=Variovorax sp. OV329 TaxID=1882825 RepID=UPI0008F2156F|nr:DUF4124 domain-containing protein [Variovorax sp. OV329]SFM66348.1 protein of unknown function [Variovorax sp. OV329]
MKLASLLSTCLGCCLLLPMGAQAQWQWIDKTGKPVFSDTAPPPDVPEKNILRRGNLPPPRPAPGVVNLGGDDAGKAPGAATAAAPAPAPETKPRVDKELEEKTRKAEEEEKAKKAAEEKKVAQAKTENCNRARQAKATYDSGIRVARLNAQGEREIIDDNMRAQEMRRLQSVIDSDCK